MRSRNNSNLPNCIECYDTGVIETGNNDLPCDCRLGAIALFNTVGVDGPVTGSEMRDHFLNNSPNPIETTGGRIDAWSLPSRIIN